MAATIAEMDDENLRKKCENASIEDAPEATKETVQLGVLPPIRLGISFSDWKQMKIAEEAKKSLRPPRVKKQFTSQLRQNQRLLNSNQASPLQNQRNNSNASIFRSQQQNLPNFSSFSQNQSSLSFNAPNQLQNLPNYMANNRQQNRQNYNSYNPSQNCSNFNSQNQRNSQTSFNEDTMNSAKIPPLKPPLSFDDFLLQDQCWSSGPLMQPMFPPMPRMPHLNLQDIRNNKSNHDNNKARPSTRVKPICGEFNAINREENTNPTQSSTTQAQVYIQRPRNSTDINEKLKPNWIAKPRAPPPMPTDTPEAREEKKRMWREYRLAMKPFKHREFANAKRVVQRLGKKPINELDEKERDRLDRAREYINSHKALLSTRLMNRSNRVEKSLQNEETNISDESTGENVYRLPPSLAKKDAWNNNCTNDSVQNSYGPPLVEDYISGGFF